MKMRITIEAIDEETGEVVDSQAGESEANSWNPSVSQWCAEAYTKVRIQGMMNTYARGKEQ